ncbi:MAG: hypothetical protein ACPG4X_15710 [Pikeienuella sp.]
MTETRFTPGPWYATENGGDDPDERRLLVGKDDEYGDFTTVADCRSKWLEDEVGGTEEANAHLIAAAPELYEAAARILSRPVSPATGGRIILEADLAALDAALAKARGES